MGAPVNLLQGTGCATGYGAESWWSMGTILGAHGTRVFTIWSFRLNDLGQLRHGEANKCAGTIETAS